MRATVHTRDSSSGLSRATQADTGIHAGREGFILIAVIWIAGLLAVASTALSVSMRSYVIYGRNAVSGAQAKAAADGVVRLAAWRAAAGTPPNTVPADGRWTACRWGDAAVWIAVQDQSGLVDLNTASPALMQALLAGAGLSSEEAVRMERAMWDYRDADSATEQGNDEPALYPGRTFGPKNAPFSVVEELDQIPGMTPDLLGKLMSLTTVESQQTGVSFTVAPDALLRALKLERATGESSPYSAPAASQALAITAAVSLPDGTRFVRQALVEPLRQPERPFTISKWTALPWPNGLDGGVKPGPFCADLQ